jgi:O-antigen ligase
LVLGILSALLGGILTASQKQCGEAIRQSRILSLLLFDAMGMKRDSLSSDGPPIGRGDVAFLIGIAAGCIGMLTSPSAILCVVPFLFLGYGILRQPESGVILLLLAVPFFGTATIGSLALFVTACWLLKVIRGKRILATNALDVSVLAFAFVVLAGGMVSVTGMESLRAAAIFLVMLSGYFIVVNLIRTSEWIVRCRRALLFALAVTATFGVVEYLLGFAPQKWLDPTMLSIIPGRCVSVFANPNVLAAALLLLLPFAMTARSLSPSGDRRLEWTVLLFVTFLCLVFTWSRGGWIGAACVVLVMALLLSRHLLARIFCILLLLPAALVCLPDSILRRILSAFHMTDTSIAYRIGIWRGTESLLSECFAGGIGMGEEAFRRVYPLYSLSTVETAPHTHNLYTQIMVSVGFTGFALFAALLLVFLRHVAAYSRTGKSDPAVLRYTASAGFSAIVGFLLMGMTDYVWYNSSVHLAFWMVLAMVNANIRISFAEQNRLGSELMSSYSVNLEIDPESLY